VASLVAIVLAALWAIWQSGRPGGLIGSEPGSFGDAGSEEWFASYLNGAKIGHAHRSVRSITEDGRRLRQVDESHSLFAMKGSDRVESAIATSEITTPDGKLVRFRHELRQSQQPTVVTGQVRGNVVEIEHTAFGINSSQRLPCSDRVEGALGLERNLSQPPIRPGESRQFEAYTAGGLGVGEHSLRAEEFDETALLDTRRKLLRVRWTAKYPNQVTFNSTVWVDELGRWQKQRNEDLGLETFRVTKEEALAPGRASPPNLLFDTLVKIERPIPNPASATSIRYRVRLENNDPAELFAASVLQSVKTIDSKTAEITVRSGGSPAADAPADAADRPAQDDRKPGVIIQSQHPDVVAMADEVGRDITDPSNLAKALTRHVHVRMKRVDYTQAFATAAEVARDLKGDCSEHAVLLAALLRARGIPARVAIGLVYVEAAQAFGYHMWTESWTGERWLPLDATLGGAAGATHIKVAATSLAAGLGDPSFLRIARLLGAKPKIEVLAVE
jgi:transglutaminase-like putative cysteine protease